MPVWLRIVLGALVGAGAMAAAYEGMHRLHRPWAARSCETTGGKLIVLPPEPFYENIFICEYPPDRAR